MIKQIKSLGLGLLIAQSFSVLNQFVIARLYSPETLGEYTLTIQIAVVVSILFFFRREYFIVEIKRKALALHYINNSFISGIKRVAFAFFFVFLVNLIVNYFTYDVLIFSIFFGITITYSVSLQQIFNMKTAFFTSGLTEAVQKSTYFIALIFFSFFASNLKSINFISLSFLLAVLVRIIYSISRLDAFQIPRVLKRKKKHYFDFQEQTSKGIVLSKNNAIAALTGILPTLFIIEFFSAENLGYFTMAITLLSLPTSLIGNSVSQVLYEHLSTHINNRNLKEINRVLVLLVITSLFFLILYFFGELLVIDIALGEKWRSSLKMIYILIPSFMISYVSKPFERSCYLFGKPKWHIISAFLKLLFISFAIVLSYISNADFYYYVKSYCIAISIHYCIDFTYNYYLIVKN